jgi:hypothetical protein
LKYCVAPEQLPTPRKIFQHLPGKEAHQRVHAEERLGVWGAIEETE